MKSHHPESWSTIALLLSALPPQFVLESGAGGTLPSMIDLICSNTIAARQLAKLWLVIALRIEPGYNSILHASWVSEIGTCRDSKTHVS